MTARRTQGFMLVEALCYVAIFLLVALGVAGVVSATCRELNLKAREEQRQEQWAKLAQDLRDDLRQATRIESKIRPAAIAPAPGVFKLVRADGSVVEYEVFEEIETYLYVAPPPPPPPPPPAPKRNWRTGRSPAAPPPPLSVATQPEKRMRNLGWCLARRVIRNGKIAQTREYAHFEGLRIQYAAADSASVWDLPDVPQEESFSAAQRFLLVTLQYKEAQQPERTLQVGASARDEAPMRAAP